jgi:hypothetical protein
MVILPRSVAVAGGDEVFLAPSVTLFVETADDRTLRCT